MSGQNGLVTALNGGNGSFIAELYARWVEDSGSVDTSFAELFAAAQDDAQTILDDARSADRVRQQIAGAKTPLSIRADQPAVGSSGSAAPDASEIRKAVLDSIRALMLIRSYRVRGHLEANLDPLELQPKKTHAELSPEFWGFSEADMERPIFIDRVLGLDNPTLREIIRVCRATYCGSLAVEFMHIQDPDQKSWIQRRVEGAPWVSSFGPDEKIKALRQLTEAEGFESYCAKKYPGTKRFGLEGGESTIPALHTIITTCAKAGVGEIAIGMAHRGRLNVLVNVVQKPFAQVFAEFQGVFAGSDDVQGSGDVKYHLGTSADIDIDGQMVHLSLQPNPSHLEAVNPVVVGKIRARQDGSGDTRGRRSAMGILLHGDAAFAGQGLVYETMAMSQLVGYRTGGTIHVVTNNQIGFTTVAAHAHSGIYCTDIAKSVQAPILHVNGDDVEATLFAAQLCAEYRQEFGCDIVLDIVCYRRHGHNEGDEPAFTQPAMYNRIREMKTTRALYAEKLALDGVLSAEGGRKLYDEFNARLDSAFQAATSFKTNKADWLEGHWSGLKSTGVGDEERLESTAVDLENLRRVGKALTSVPDGFIANPKILRQLEAKEVAIRTGEGIDWATAEALAFGSLLIEGHRVRLSGEDVQRGTFSHRHCVLIDQTNQNEYVPLNNIIPGQRKFEAFNSLLSEAGVLGFDYGYSLADPHTLVLWEAQFGDFSNGAQVIIDQFIASGETKWLRMSGLVMLLPHGYEGQGPEHSSARPERYLQLCAERNMRVCNITTPANYFHALRRQIKANYRKPLVLFTPKSLLRHKLAISNIADFSKGSSFRYILPEIDQMVPDDKIRRVVLCTGKVYYDLLQYRRESGINDVAILRLEQIYPFPRSGLGTILGNYPNADVLWCQEEPANMGAWTFVDRKIEATLRDIGHAFPRPLLSGRDEAASPATGVNKVHLQQQTKLVHDAFA